MRLRPISIALATLLGACAAGPEAATPPAPPAAPSARGPQAPSVSAPPTKVSRDRFNAVAFASGEPVFWENDKDGNGEPSEGEVRSLLFHDAASPLAEIVARVAKRAVAKQTPAADARLGLIAQETSQIRPILVRSDLRDLAPSEKTMVRHLLEATKAVDRLHARQRGMMAVAGKVAAADAESRALFRRNWGPRCVAPTTETQPQCTALPGVDTLPVDVYPAALQRDPKFCATLEKHPAQKSLLDPFTVVRERAGALIAVPMHEATTTLDGGAESPYRVDLEAAASALDAAQVAARESDTALADYLKAAAKAFRDGSWFDADVAWSNMSARTSRFFVRIGPDETYWEPCARKAGFHVSFARVDKASLAWQDKLEPVKQSLEEAIAAAAGPPYRARKVAFHLPEFIDVVWNGGDSRDALGATVGQSLPNWGPVAAKNKGRTVAMANLYTDPDSVTSRARAASALLCAESMKNYSTAREASLVSTILHEATHNLGPAQEYRVRGKTDEQWLGGGLASTMEELKAQTGALYFLDLLQRRGVLSEALMRASATDSVVWAFGHVARGMVSPSGERKPYGQLAAIQLGVLEEQGALEFRGEALSANGTDRGCFAVRFEAWTKATEALMGLAARPKATGDKALAEALAKKHVDAALHHAIIRDRMLREPRPSFVYAIELD